MIAGGLNPADAALQARTVATAVNNKISGAGVAGTGADMFRAVSESGPMGKLAARTLDVPYEVLAPYMEHDAYNRYEGEDPLESLADAQHAGSGSALGF